MKEIVYILKNNKNNTYYVNKYQFSTDIRDSMLFRCPQKDYETKDKKFIKCELIF